MEIVVALHVVLDDFQLMSQWFQRPNKHFKGSTPQSMINSGHEKKVLFFLEEKIGDGSKNVADLIW